MDFMLDIILYVQKNG